MPSICLVAGDPSGDAHAARLVEALTRQEPTLTFAGLGGPQMRQAGVDLLDDLTQSASIGPFDAAKHLRRFAQARRRFASHLTTTPPDLVILVDFGDFNLPVIAPLVKRYGIPIVYYVSPQLWAWGQFRVRWVKRYVDRMLVLFKFEEPFYRRHGVPVTWVGHPLIDTAKASVPREHAQRELGLNPWRMTVGLLPGSRAQEITRHLPLLLNTAKRIAWHMPGVQFLLPKAAHVPAQLFAAIQRFPELDVIVCDNRLYDCLQVMEGCVIASGTATLEAALFEVPMVVVYRTSALTYLAAKFAIRVPHIAIVNLITDEAIVPEYVQHRATPNRLAEDLVSLLRHPERKTTMQQRLRTLKERLGPPGAIERAAQAVLEELDVQKSEDRKQKTDTRPV